MLKGWTVKIKAEMVKYAIITPMIASILSLLGSNDIPASLLTLILPSIFEIENIELNRKEEEVLASLPLNKKGTTYMSIDQWYDTLPKKIQKQVNYLDFVDFMEKIVFAGFAKSNDVENYLI